MTLALVVVVTLKVVVGFTVASLVVAVARNIFSYSQRPGAFSVRQPEFLFLHGELFLPLLLMDILDIDS